MPDAHGTAHPDTASSHAEDLERSVVERNHRAQTVALVVALVFAVFGLARLYIATISDQYQVPANSRVRINLNEDPQAAIELLPRVGPNLAKRIVAERGERGPFADLNDLMHRVPGIGPKTAEALERHVAFTAKP